MGTANVCETCSSSQFEMIDGFFYCSVCSTQSQGHRELGTEEIDESYMYIHGALRITNRTKRGRDEDRKGGEGKTAVLESEIDDEFFPAVCNTDYPRFLGQPAHRIATFTKLLSRFCDVLSRDFDVPVTVRDHALHIWQRYLAKFEVAFHEGEITENEDERYCPVLKNMNARAEERAEQKALKIQREEEVMNRSQMKRVKREGDLFESLLADDLEEEEDELHTEYKSKVQHVEHHESSVKLKSMERARRIPLTVELAQAMLYLAGQCAGSHWILVSDMARWFREGRFRFSRPHLASLPRAPRRDDDADSAYGCSTRLRSDVDSFPLDYHLRLVYILAQIADVPRNPIVMDFDQMLARLVYNLNLPRAFLHRCHIVLTALPAISSNVLDLERIHRVAELDQKWFERFNLQEQTVDLFCFCFVGESRSMKREAMGLNTGLNLVVDDDRYSPVMRRCFSIEAKAIALICFTLKLIFGLDDQREREMRSRTRAGEGDNDDSGVEQQRQFDLMRWMLQLRLRVESWRRGHRPAAVLNKRFFVTDPRLPSGEMSRRCVGRVGQLGLRNDDAAGAGMRCADFQHCVPSSCNHHPRDYAFQATFVNDDVVRELDHIADEALIAPLRYQATLNADWRDKNADGGDSSHSQVDVENEEIFFENYTHHSMDYEQSEPRRLSDQVPRVHCGPDRELACDEEFARLFPCANCYLRYDIQTHVQLYVHRPVSEAKRPRRVLEPVALAHECETLYAHSRAHFSTIFEELLEYFALVIGEHRSSIYFLIVALEFALFESQRLEEMEVKIRSSKCLSVNRWFNFSQRKEEKRFRVLGVDGDRNQFTFEFEESYVRKPKSRRQEEKVDDDSSTAIDAGENRGFAGESDEMRSAAPSLESGDDDEDAALFEEREEDEEPEMNNEDEEGVVDRPVEVDKGDGSDSALERGMNRTFFFDTNVFVPLVFWRHW